MKKTKLVPITNLDQITVGSRLAAGTRRWIVLAKIGEKILFSPTPEDEKNSRYIKYTTLQRWEFLLEIPDEPWTPEEGRQYFYPQLVKGGGFGSLIWLNQAHDKRNLEINFVSKTPEEAVIKAQKMLDSIKEN